MSFLIDTNVLSELRRADRANPGVSTWARTTPEDQVFLSVITLLELERGIVRSERRQLPHAPILRSWFDLAVRPGYATRTLPITSDIALRAAAFEPSRTIELADELIAATAIVHGLTLVTRNVKDFAHTRASVLNPFSP